MVRKTLPARRIRIERREPPIPIDMDADLLPGERPLSGRYHRDDDKGFRVVLDGAVGSGEEVHRTFQEAAEAVKASLGFEVSYLVPVWPKAKARAYLSETGERIVEGDPRFDQTTWYQRGATLVTVIEEVLE
jgi:hypothetical protein